jgi:hypothetical protein
MDNRTYQRTRYGELAAAQNPQSSCLSYFERFCQRANKILATYPDRRISRADYRPPELERDTVATRFGPAILADESQSVIPGMRVGEAVLRAAQQWASTPPAERVKRVGWIEELAREAGCSRSTLLKAGNKILAREAGR